MFTQADRRTWTFLLRSEPQCELPLSSGFTPVCGFEAITLAIIAVSSYATVKWDGVNSVSKTNPAPITNPRSCQKPSCVLSCAFCSSHVYPPELSISFPKLSFPFSLQVCGEPLQGRDRDIDPAALHPDRSLQKLQNDHRGEHWSDFKTSVHPSYVNQLVITVYPLTMYNSVFEPWCFLALSLAAYKQRPLLLCGVLRTQRCCRSPRSHEWEEDIRKGRTTLVAPPFLKSQGSVLRK